MLFEQPRQARAIARLQRLQDDLVLRNGALPALIRQVCEVAGAPDTRRETLIGRREDRVAGGRDDRGVDRLVEAEICASIS